MKAYQTITLQPFPEISVSFLWEKVYQQVHLALVEHANPSGLSPFGVAFPKYGDTETFPLGAILRVFGSEEKVLEQLNIAHKLSRFADYVHLTGIREVPDHVEKYVVYKRQQPKSSIERLARRKAKREDISYQAALEALGDFREQHVKMAYIQMKSLSSQKHFRLFISEEFTNTPKSGSFSTYGLSLNHTTVPHF